MTDANGSVGERGRYRDVPASMIVAPPWWDQEVEVFRGREVDVWTRNGVRKNGTAALLAKAPKAARLLRHPVRSAKRAIVLRGLRSFVTPRNGARLGALLAVPAAIMALRNVGRR